MNTTHRRAAGGAGAFALALASLVAAPAGAVPVVAPAFSGVYSLQSLGGVPGLPSPYGGLAFIDNDTLLIGGRANVLEGRLYTIDVLRDGDGHISGFAGAAAEFGSVGEFNDGGVVFGPGGVLFTARWPENELGQTLPGDLDEMRITNLTGLGIAPSPGGLMFVPPGLPGAGQLKLVSWEGGEWYTLSLALAPDGTYDILAAALGPTLAGGPEGIAYVPPGSPLFANPSVLISEYSAGNVAVYEVDGSGQPDRRLAPRLRARSHGRRGCAGRSGDGRFPVLDVPPRRWGRGPAGARLRAAAAGSRARLARAAGPGGLAGLRLASRRPAI